MNTMGLNISTQQSAGTSEEPARLLDETPAAENVLGGDVESARLLDETSAAESVLGGDVESARLLDETPAAENVLGGDVESAAENVLGGDVESAAESVLGGDVESAAESVLEGDVESARLLDETPAAESVLGGDVESAQDKLAKEVIEYQYNKFVEELNYLGIQRNPQYFKDRVTEVPDMLTRIAAHLNGIQQVKDSKESVSVFDGVTNLMSIFIIIGDIDCIKYVLDHNPALHLKGISAYKPLITYWQSEPEAAQEMVKWLNEAGATWVDNPMMLELQRCSLDFVKFLFESGIYYSAYEAARPLIAEYNSLTKLNRGLGKSMFNTTLLSEKVQYLLDREGALSFINADYFDMVAAESIAIVDIESVKVTPDSVVEEPKPRLNYGDKYTMREFLYEIVCFDTVFVDILYRKIPADLVDQFAALHLDNLIFSLPFDDSEINNNNYDTQLAATQYIVTNFPYIFPRLMFGNRLQISELVKNNRIQYDFSKYVDPDEMALYNKK